MTGETPPRNELIQRLVGRLTTEGREAWEDLQRRVNGASAGDDPEEVLGSSPRRLALLPDGDQEVLTMLHNLEVRARRVDLEGAEMRVARVEREMISLVFERAYELLDSEGGGAEPETFREAVAILERHGQRLPTSPVSVQAIELLAERAVEDRPSGGEG